MAMAMGGSLACLGWEETKRNESGLLGDDGALWLNSSLA